MKSIPTIWWRLTRRNVGSIAILTLQAVITMLILIGLIGKIQMVDKAKRITDAFQNQNAIYFTEYACYHESLPNLAQLFAEKTETASVKSGEITDLLLKTEDGATVAAYGYNDVMIEAAKITLTDGVWLDQSLQSDFIPVIAVDRQYAVGSELSFVHPQDQTPVKAVVIGTIENDTYIPTFNRSSSPDIASLSFFVSTPQFPLIVPYQCARIASFQKDMAADTSAERGKIILTGSPAASEAAQSSLKPYGTCVDVEQMAAQYQQENRDHMITNGIVLLLFSVLSVAGIGGVNGIQSLLNEKRFIIYYMLGLTQKKCICIEALRSLTPILFSFLLTVILYGATPVQGLYAADSFHINALTFLLIFLFLLVIYACTSVGFLIKLGRKNLMQNYRQSTLE